MPTWYQVTMYSMRKECRRVIYCAHNFCQFQWGISMQYFICIYHQNKAFTSGDESIIYCSNLRLILIIVYNMKLENDIFERQLVINMKYYFVLLGAFELCLSSDLQEKRFDDLTRDRLCQYEIAVHNVMMIISLYWFCAVRKHCDD